MAVSVLSAWLLVTALCRAGFQAHCAFHSHWLNYSIWLVLLPSLTFTATGQVVFVVVVGGGGGGGGDVGCCFCLLVFDFPFV